MQDLVLSLCRDRNPMHLVHMEGPRLNGNGERIAVCLAGTPHFCTPELWCPWLEDPMLSAQED